MKKIVLLFAVVMLVVIPCFSAFAETSTDPAKTEEIKTETTPPPADDSSDIFSTLSKSVAMIGNFLPYLLFCTVGIIALWVFFDASRRTKYGWIWGIASLLVIPWIVYVIWRPQYTLEEKKMLEADEDLRRIEHDYYQYVLTKEKHICSVCGTPLESDYKICPNCYTEVKKTCPKCGKPLELDWKVCPYCGNR